MQEPSILDYIRSLLKPGTPKIKLSDFDQINSSEDNNDIQEPFGIQNGTNVESDTAAESGTHSQKIEFPLLPLAIVLLGIIGQWQLEPSNRNTFVGVFFYCLALALLIFGFITKRFVLFTNEEQEPRPYSTKIRWQYLVMAFVVGLITFITYGNHLFTTLNLFLWGLCIALVLMSFWTRKEADNHAKRQNWFSRVFKQGLDLKIKPAHLLFFGLIILVAFFRFGELDQIPGEMFSDHAEKLLDVADVLDGNYWTFFPRNTGREAFQMYLTAFNAVFLGTGLSFMSLKIGTALAGFVALFYMYLLGKEIGGTRIGLLTFLMGGIAYWPNVISRVGLRFPLYALFAAPAIYYLVRGIRQSRRNDFILSGIFLGIGLHGYSPARFVPFLVTFAVILFIVHQWKKGVSKQTIIAWILLAVTSLAVFLPLMRYWFDDPQMFAYRSLSRLGEVERAYPGNPILIFFQNLWDAMVMFFHDNGNVWVHSVPSRPALDLITAVFFFIGFAGLIWRYIRKRNWLDIFLIISIPVLMMPSILSLAFPEENPSLNRTSAAIIPVFLIAAIGMDGFIRSLESRVKNEFGRVLSWMVVIFLIFISIFQNYDLVFNQYKNQFLAGAWNTSDIGEVIKGFDESIGDSENAFVVPYAHWVDTRLVGINADDPLRDYALWSDQFESTLIITEPKLFILKPEDQDSLIKLQNMYPEGSTTFHMDDWDGKDFVIYFVPADSSGLD